jgi:hypothetical protein
MPIAVACKCGKKLQVPDQLAGKAAKCPACGNAFKIPAAAVAPAAASGGLAELLEEAGVAKKKGRFCPKCDAPMPGAAVLCIHCGYRTDSNEQLEGHELASAGQEFGNKHLNEAAQMMRREKASADRMLDSGTPWWVILATLLGFVLCATAGVILVDARVIGMQPEGTPIGRVQRLPVLVTLAGVGFLVAALIDLFAHLVLTAKAYRESRKQGVLCTLIPGYSLIYGTMRFRDNPGTTLSYWLASLVAGGLGAYVAMNL